MELRALGTTGINVSRLCFGTLTLSPLQCNLPVGEGARVMMSSFERGVNFLDTAELYENYEPIKRAISAYPQTVVATKSYAYDEAGAEASLEKALRELDREYIDIFLMHEQESEHTLRGHMGALEYYFRQKREGRIRAVGISTHFIAGVMAAAKLPEIDVIHPLINLRGIGIADGTAADMEAAIALAADRGKGIYAMKPLGGGHLISDSVRALDYALKLEGVASIAMGMQSGAEVAYNCKLFSQGLHDGAMRHELQKRERRLHVHEDWCSGCGSCVKACKGGALSVEDGKVKVAHSRCVLCGYCASACEDFCIKVL